MPADDAQRRFDMLEGDWQLRRRMRDFTAPPAGGMNARLSGQARFSRVDAQTLDYWEEGVLRLASGQRVRAERRYRYRLSATGLRIMFGDGPDLGKLYLQLDWPEADGETNVGTPASTKDARKNAPDDARALRDDHLCGRDLYQALYRFRGFAPAPLAAAVQEGQGQHTSAGSVSEPLRIVQHTVVSGPRKDYAIVSILTRGSA